MKNSKAENQLQLLRKKHITSKKFFSDVQQLVDSNLSKNLLPQLAQIKKVSEDTMRDSISISYEFAEIEKTRGDIQTDFSKIEVSLLLSFDLTMSERSEIINNKMLLSKFKHQLHLNHDVEWKVTVFHDEIFFVYSS